MDDFARAVSDASWEQVLHRCLHKWVQREDEDGYWSGMWKCEKCKKEELSRREPDEMTIGDYDGEWVNFWNPAGDLNDIYELQKRMKESQFITYLSCILVERTEQLRLSGDRAELRIEQLWELRHVTARQCAKAMVESGFVKLKDTVVEGVV